MREAISEERTRELKRKGELELCWCRVVRRRNAGSRQRDSGCEPAPGPR